MVAVRPFDGQVVRPQRVGEVVSPAYDALTAEQRRQHRETHPLSYLHVTRSAPNADDPVGADSEALVRGGREALERIIEADVFEPAQDPTFMVYELEVDGHRQRGVVAEVLGSEFHRWAKPHEATRSERARLLAEHLRIVRAASSPVACTVADGAALQSALEGVRHCPPHLEHASDGLVQRIWALDESGASEAIRSALDAEHLYIIDGHHRADANGRLLAEGHDVPLLVAIFPPSSLQLAGFHRLLRLPDGTSEREFVQQVRRRFRAIETDGLIAPTPGSIAMRADGRWWRVELDERPVGGGPLVRLGSLDPCVVEREIVQAVAGRDQAADTLHMPDEDSHDAVVAEADRQARIPILVAPVTVADMIEVADGGLVMPPKSTYFTPKVRSGLFLRRYESFFGAP